MDLTVHSLPEAVLDAGTRRRRAGRLQMALVLLACLAPVLASYAIYYGVRPLGRTNYGELIEPMREMPAALALRELDGAQVDPTGLRGQWLLVIVSGADCDAGCQQRVYLQRQLREMLGKDRDRVDRLWLLTGAGRPADAVVAAASATPGLRLLRAPAENLARWLKPAAGQTLADHLYVIDPMGMWMMRAPVDPDPMKLKKDLLRLLRASASWDRAGR